MTITQTDAVNDVTKLERLKVLNNGEKVALTFSDAEFERRLAGLRRIMAEKDLDAVVLTSYHSHQVLLGLPVHLLRPLLRHGGHQG